MGLYINREFKGNYGGNVIKLHGESEGARKTYEFFKKYFEVTRMIQSTPNKQAINHIIIDDLTEITVKKWEKSESKKFEPSEVKIIDDNRGVMLLKMKIHHTRLLGQR